MTTLVTHLRHRDSFGGLFLRLGRLLSLIELPCNWDEPELCHQRATQLSADLNLGAACAWILLLTFPSLDAPGNKPLPKLVLFIVIDGFPQDQLVRYYDQFNRGFKLFLDHGAWYGNCPDFSCR